MPKTIEIWISERGNFSAFPKPSEEFPDWTEKLSRFVPFETMREELAEAYGIDIPDEDAIDFKPTLFGMQKATLTCVEDAGSSQL